MSLEVQSRDIAPEGARAPVGLWRKLTRRCSLQCPYCSQPLALERIADELPTRAWLDVLTQAAELGVLQLHLSGGERTVRRDLDDIVGWPPSSGSGTARILAPART